MASVQIFKYSPSPVSVSQPKFLAKSIGFFSESYFRKTILRLPNCRSPRYSLGKRFRECCAAQEHQNDSNESRGTDRVKFNQKGIEFVLGEEPPESLFMKELKRRGMTPTSLLEDTNRSDYGLNDGMREKGSAFSQRNAVSTEVEKGLANQRERSMKLNSEGIEGLVPRAKLLLTLGGTFFLAFWPLIIITISLFSALYFFFGPSFVHDVSRTPISPPQYVDPYALLEDERISQAPPRVN